MKLMYLLVCVCDALVLQRATLIRAPLQSDAIVLQAPKSYQMRERVETATGRAVQFDPKPEVVEKDRRLGLYELRWVGYDGHLKSVVVQMPNRIDIVVSANVTRRADGYEYLYRVANLKTSAESLSAFVVQSLSNDSEALKIPGVIIAPANKTPPFAKGVWYGFLPIELKTRVPPGGTAEYRVTSSRPPGLVECRVSGADGGYKGAGEEMPYELESVIPGHMAWPHGFTIGPSEELAGLSRQAKEQRLAEWLPTFDKLGWMASGELKNSQAALGSSGLTGLDAFLNGELTSGRVADEVVAIVKGMLR